MVVKTSMQKTWSNGWPLTRISSKRLCRMKTSSAPSQMGFKTIMMETASLKIPHPHISYRWNVSFRSGIMLCGAAIISFPIDVMLIKNGKTMWQVAELLGFNKKRLVIF
ncbi:hypothetical protein AVEN_193043-1 [Araneus ventricosus]|uniref:Uncharacterized protein n=1 Tax=Araneus ventricosus TaxID=182803 RepID=A0A4Y2N440_ARAVE|nr:hypothetical protein AVEN_193043-1 [Araneus ventricosus]